VRWLAALSGALLVVVALVANPGVARADTSWYQLVAQHSGKCMEVSGGSPADGTAIVQSTCGYGPAPQLWTLVYLGMGHSQIQSVASGKCIDVDGSRATWGALIVQNTCGTADGQNWIITHQQPNDLTTVRVQSDESNQPMCINVAGASQADGASLIQWPCVGASNEIFNLKKFVDIR
jgi:hypothetical protein